MLRWRAAACTGSLTRRTALPRRLLQGLAFKRPLRQQPGAHLAIYWARRKFKCRAATSSK